MLQKVNLHTFLCIAGYTKGTYCQDTLQSEEITPPSANRTHNRRPVSHCVTTIVDNCKYKQIKKINQLYAVSRIQQGRQREPSNKTLRGVLAWRVEWRNLTPLFASIPERRNWNINFNKYFFSSSWYRTHNRRVQVLCPWATTASSSKVT